MSNFPTCASMFVHGYDSYHGIEKVWGIYGGGADNASKFIEIQNSLGKLKEDESLLVLVEDEHREGLRVVVIDRCSVATCHEGYADYDYERDWLGNVASPLWLKVVKTNNLDAYIQGYFYNPNED
ncbi:hypothetical protein ACPF04_06550 [Campylobacter sp. MOP51]|uniref:hypothetical protein n=1 Tax=Campylobacter canis TaxID=3378588 RepID=UPI003C5CD1A7